MVFSCFSSFFPGRRRREVVFVDRRRRRRAVDVDVVADVVIGPSAGDGARAPPRVIARDGRVEYCRPQVAWLADGRRLVARLNLVTSERAPDADAGPRAAGARAAWHGRSLR